MYASSALKGSTSTTETRAPMPRNLSATPFADPRRTPITTTRFPPTCMLVALMTPSRTLCPLPKPVVVQVLAHGVVDGYHREAQDALPLHRAEAQDAGRRLLGRPDYPGRGAGLVRHHGEISAVVYYQLGPVVQDAPVVPQVLLLRLPLQA
jgi:hypothetical protein